MGDMDHILKLPDEMLKHIILFLPHWDKEALRQVNQRFYNLVVNDVRKIVITQEWVDSVVKASKRGSCLKRSKLKSFEKRERKEKMVVLYVCRHRNLRCLHFYQAGLSYIHRCKDWQGYFTKKLATKCPNIEELLVQGTSGLSLAKKYAETYKKIHKEPCQITSLLIDPYQAGAIFCSRLEKLGNECPHLYKLTLISERNDTNLSQVIPAMKKMLNSYSEKLKYFATDFTADFAFKLAAIETLQNLDGLTLCRSLETVNKYPFQPATLNTINGNNPQLHRLRIPVTSESIYNLKEFQNLTELSIIFSHSLTQSLFRDVFRTIGLNISLLSITFAPSIKSNSSCQSEFDASFDFSLCRNLHFLSIQGSHNLQFDQLLAQLGVNCRLLNEIHYSRQVKDALDLLPLMENLPKLCPVIRLVVVNDTKFKGNNGLLWRCEGDASDSCQQLEKQVFY